ncbi:MAG: hypothetical protein N4A76_06735 [Firmicutes bacterium]|jgi:uncharacterized membrane protein YraQ (UPF0718 family)|nr:hypothetical protein [Bacillota bacterium]
MNNWMIAGIVVVIVIGALAALYFNRKRGMEQLFQHVYDNARQVPGKKRKSFLLFMFRETITTPRNKKKAAAHASKLNNRVYVETQMVKMTNILKDTSKVTDKTIKRALTMLQQYYIWEKAKREEEKK